MSNLIKGKKAIGEYAGRPLFDRLFGSTYAAAQEAKAVTNPTEYSVAVTLANKLFKNPNALSRTALAIQEGLAPVRSKTQIGTRTYRRAGQFIQDRPDAQQQEDQGFKRYGNSGEQQQSEQSGFKRY
jgi:hypothetical protein